MTLRLTLGCDPGLSGCIAVLADGHPFRLIDMPFVTLKNGKHRLDPYELSMCLRTAIMIHPGAHVSAVVEVVGSAPMEGRKQGGSSMFGFGQSDGMVRGILGCLRIPVTEVHPITWKNHYGLLKTEKDVARLLAIRRFPSIAHDLKRKKDGGRADALLLALWHENTDQLGRAAA